MHTLALLAALLAADPVPGDLDARAQKFVAALSRGEFEAIVADFDAAMLKALPATKLKTIWEAVTQRFGAFQKPTGTRTETKGKFEVVYVTCQFANGPLDVRLVFDAEKKVSGLQFLPPRPAVEYKSPAYVRPDSFQDKEVVVGAGTEWDLPGTLTLPQGAGPFPAVVLLHGSGPHDRDESIGPNKPFRDIAEGLASRGIAVLRFEKRTRHHAAKMADAPITVREEVLDDALAAINLLRKTPGIDPKRVYVLGHSLGALMAPKLATLDPQLAGIIVMAGPTRPLVDVLIDQLAYVGSLQGEQDTAAKEQIAKLKEQAARLKGSDLTPQTPAKDLPFGVPAAYWLSFRGYDPAAVAAKSKVPVLILHGDRDYQVTRADYEGWEKALSGKPHATLKHYPTLNHLFMEGEGKATPAEYEKAGHVAPVVVADIGDWIKK